jgi:Chalcone-flavanone isomerase
LDYIFFLAINAHNEGPFDKLSRITLTAHLGGKEFTQKVIENCTVYLKKNCLYTQEEEKATKEFQKLFEPIDLPPGTTIFFTYCASGQLMVS